MNPFLYVAAAATKVPSAAATLLPTGAPNAPGAVPGAVPPMMPQVAPATWMATHAPWLTHGIAGLFMIAAVVLIGLLAVQTTKQEGLTGSIGGRVESAYRGRLGAEEQLKRWTGVAAVTFVVSAFVLSLTGI